MEMYYRFLSESEPTDKQLDLIMIEVAVEAKSKAEHSNKLFWEQLQKMIDANQIQKLTTSLNKIEKVMESK